MVKATAVKTNSSGTLRKVAKSSTAIRRDEDSDVKELLSKLRSIVPTESDEVSALDIVQNAIYYIQDLNDLLAQAREEVSSNVEFSDDEKENKDSFNAVETPLFTVPDVFASGNKAHFSSAAGLHPTPVC